MRVFFDSSAFVKRYVREEGTDAVLSWCDQASVIRLSVLKRTRCAAGMQYTMAARLLSTWTCSCRRTPDSVMPPRKPDYGLSRYEPARNARFTPPAA